MLGSKFARTALKRMLPTSRLIHRSDDTIQHQIKEHILEKTPITAQLWQMRKAERNAALRNEKTAVEFEVKEIPSSQSRLTLEYNFSEDPNLRDMYADHMGNVLIGKLFEDLDALAGNIAFNHCEVDKLGKNVNLVTASVDKIIQTKPISICNDLVLTGQVAWVGKSSMDIVMEIHDKNKLAVGEQPTIVCKTSKTRLLSSIFTFVCRDGITGRAAPVNKVIVESEEETRMFYERKKISDARKTKTHGLTYDLDLVTQLVDSGSAVEDLPALAHPNAVLMKLTGLENSFICNPQNVNTAGRIFGGFLVHRAYDLALATCYTFAGSYPVFKQVNEISFKKPVDIGDLVRLKSRVVYSSDSPTAPLVMIEVTCQVVRPERASSFVSNTFNFVFSFGRNMSLRTVLPVNAEEAHVLLAGAHTFERDLD